MLILYHVNFKKAYGTVSEAIQLLEVIFSQGELFYIGLSIFDAS